MTHIRKTTPIKLSANANITKRKLLVKVLSVVAGVVNAQVANEQYLPYIT